MGSGMLWAALAGGAKGGMKAMDDMEKRDAEERQREQRLLDSREQLLYEMKLKADMARQAELDDAQKYDGAVGRAEMVGNDRRFAKFRDDLRATGGGEGMSEEQLREVFDSQYNNKQSTAEAGGTRYMEPESRNKADVLDELRKGGASGGLLKTARDDLASTQRAEQLSRSEALKEKQLEQRDRQFAERLDQQAMLADERNRVTLEAADRRASGSGKKSSEIDQTEKLSVLKDVKAKADATRPKRSDYASEKRYEEAMTKWQDSEDGQISTEASRRIKEVFGGTPSKAQPMDDVGSASSDVDALRREISRVEGGKDNPSVKSERLAILREGLRKAEGQAKTAGQKSTVKDNQTTGAPPKVSSKAEYDALPKGARYVAPDGTVRTKG